ncbi:MAG: hypothetical protein V4649_10625 [Bacteroidota bacterium]
MTRTLGCLAVAMIFLFSCQRSKRELLVGTWHAVKLDNPQMDSFFTNSQAFIDTMGKDSTPDDNIATYGTANMDSLRLEMQHQYDSAKTMQYSAVLNTAFRFRKDNVAVLDFNDNIDSAKWAIDGDKLVLDDLGKETVGQKLSMEIMTLADTVLKLKFIDNGASSIVTFHPGEK